MTDPQTSTAANRREFLQAGAVAAAAVPAFAGSRPAEAQDANAPVTLPKRKLGNTGAEVTILTLGTGKTSGLDRILRTAFANGVRYYDTARVYGSEPGFKRWFEQMPEVRDQIFLVTKDSPREPGQLLTMLDQRLEALGTDHIDLFFIHALGDHDFEHEKSWPKDPAFGRVIEKIKASGKAKHVGFSSHHVHRAELLQAAAEGGFIDAIMLQYSPWLDKDSPLNKAIDACHAKGIGLVSMKQVAGQFNPSGGGVDILKQVVEKMPALKERGLSPYQGLLQAIWSDERISSACVSMRNTDQIRENSEAARTFEPLKEADVRALKEAALAAGPTLCADCDGRCSRAAGTTARLGDLTRYLTYHEHHGDRVEARRQYAALAQTERDWTGADLEAARAACPSKLDFAALIPKAERLLS